MKPIQWQAAKYTENAALQMYELAKAGARTETKRAAQEKVRMAAGAVAEVEAYAKDTQIHSWYQAKSAKSCFIQANWHHKVSQW